MRKVADTKFPRYDHYAIRKVRDAKTPPYNKSHTRELPDCIRIRVFLLVRIEIRRETWFRRSRNFDQLSVKPSFHLRANLSDCRPRACAGFSFWSVVLLAQTGRNDQSIHGCGTTSTVFFPGLSALPILPIDWSPVGKTRARTTSPSTVVARPRQYSSRASVHFQYFQ